MKPVVRTLAAASLALGFAATAFAQQGVSPTERRAAPLIHS